jgi:hypothetical protein
MPSNNTFWLIASTLTIFSTAITIFTFKSKINKIMGLQADLIAKINAEALQLDAIQVAVNDLKTQAGNSDQTSPELQAAADAYFSKQQALADSLGITTTPTTPTE